MILPYVLGIQLNQSGGSARANSTIIITNNRTGDTQSGNSNSSGQIVFDLANFSQGYIRGDTIDIEKQALDSEMEYFVTANGDETNPSWIQINDEIKTKIYPNTTRIKLNTTRNPGGRNDLIITLD